MRIAPGKLLTLPTLLLALGCAPQETATVEEEVTTSSAAMLAEVEEATEKIQASYIAAYNAEDGAAIAALFAPDGTIAPPELASIEQAGIAAYYDAQFASGADFTLDVDREGMFVSGDMMVAWGTYAVSMVMEGAEPMGASGRYGSISKKQPDGSWKIYRHMFNFINPPPEM